MGAAAAAALVAIIAPIIMWASASASDSTTSSSQPGMHVAAMVIGVCVLVSLGLWRTGRRPGWFAPMALAGLGAAGMGAWCIWGGGDLFRARPGRQLVDSTGATVLVETAVLAGLAAAVLGLVAAAVIDHVNGRTALCAFAIVALVSPVLINRSVEEYLAGVWHPELTATDSPPAPLAGAIGSVRYQLDLPRGTFPAVYRAANGFIVYTREGVSAYDGPTGAERWRATGVGSSSGGPLRGAQMVWRDRHDTTGIVVLFFDGALVALDGGSGEVMWRRQYSGELTSSAGAIDALGMSIFSVNAFDNDTVLYSLDPSTGALRWSRSIACSSPTAAPGTSGQFFFSCGQAPSAIDARTGSTIDIPGAHNRAPSAGSDVYVASNVVPVSSQDGPKPTDATLVIDPQQRIIDQVPGTYPASAANDGFVLVYGGGDTWLLRDYRKHQSMPVPIHLDTTYGLGDVETAWLRTSLANTMRSGAQPLLLVDPTHPVAEPTSAVAPCTRHELKRRIQAVAGAVILQCEGRSTRIVGLVPSGSERPLAGRTAASNMAGYQ